MPAHGRESRLRDDKFITGRFEAVFDHASAQHQVLSGAELLALGVSRQLAADWTLQRRLHRIHQGVYALVPRTRLTIFGHWLAAVRACGEGARLSHLSCAHLLNICRGPGYPIHITVPRRSALRMPGITVHRAPLPVDQITTRASIPCTSFARTLLDIAPQLTPDGLRSALDRAEIERLDFTELPGIVSSASGRPGIRKLRAALTEVGIGVDVTRNGLEEAFRAICRERCLPQPRVNHWLDLGDALPMVELDFYWPALSAVVETDGAGTHGTVRAVERDYGRERRIARAGLILTRFSEPEVVNRPTTVGDELTEFLAHAGL